MHRWPGPPLRPGGITGGGGPGEGPPLCPGPGGVTGGGGPAEGGEGPLVEGEEGEEEDRDLDLDVVKQ